MQGKGSHPLPLPRARRNLFWTAAAGSPVYGCQNARGETRRSIRDRSGRRSAANRCVHPPAFRLKRLPRGGSHGLRRGLLSVAPCGALIAARAMRPIRSFIREQTSPRCGHLIVKADRWHRRGDPERPRENRFIAPGRRFHVSREQANFRSHHNLVGHLIPDPIP